MRMKKLKTKIKLWYYFKYTYPKWEENTTPLEKYRNYLRLKAYADAGLLDKE